MTRNQIVELYSATFNRAADADGVAYWETQTNLTQEQMANSFVISEEAVALYPATQTNTEYVTAIYNNLFGRAPDTAGLAYWVGKLDDGTDKKESMIAAFINGAAAADKAVLDNKTAVSLYAVEQGSNTTTVSLSSVDATETSVTAAKTAVNEANPNFGETFVLTTSATDVLNGTAKNDLFDGSITDSLQAGDILLDSSSTDADILNASVTTDNIKARIQNVETLNIDGKYVTTGLDLTDVTGGKSLNLNTGYSNGTAKVTAASTLATEKIKTGDSIKTLDIEAAGFGTRDTLVVDANKAEEVTLSVIAAGATAINKFDVTTTGNVTIDTMAANSEVKLNLSDAKTTITGDGALGSLTINQTGVDGEITIGGAMTAVATATGKVKTTINSDKNVTVKADIANIGGTAMDSSGAGELTVQITDALVAGGTDLSSVKADVIDVSKAVTGAAVVTTNASSKVKLSADVAGTSLTITQSYDATKTGADALANGKGTLLLEVAKTQSTDVIIGAKTKTVILNAGVDKDAKAHETITVDDLQLGANADTLLIQGAEDLTLTTLTTNTAGASFISAADMTGNLTVAAIVGTQPATITLGKGNDKLTTNAAGKFTIEGTAGNNTINIANALLGSKVNGGTGDDTITGNALGSTLNGGAGNDTISIGGTVGTTIDAGAGNDIVNLKVAGGVNKVTVGTGNDIVNLAADVGTAATDTVEITDFVKGTDKLVLTGTDTVGAVDVTKATVANNVYTFNADYVVTLKNNTATDMSDSVQLGHFGIDAADATLAAAQKAYDDKLLAGTANATDYATLAAAKNTNAVANAFTAKLGAAAPGETVKAGSLDDTILLTNAAAAANIVTVTLGAGKDSVIMQESATAHVITDFNKAEDILILAGAATAAVDLTAIQPNGATATYAFGGGSEYNIELTDVKEDYVKSFVQLGTKDIAFTAKDGVTTKGGDLADYITTNATGGHLIVGGKGADSITLLGTTKTETVQIAAGDSIVGAMDTVIGFEATAATADVLKLTSENIATVVGSTKVGNITGVTVKNGVVTAWEGIDNVINADTLDAALAFLAANVGGTDTIAFEYAQDLNGNGVVTDFNEKSTFVFQNGATDTVVELVGLSGVTALGTTAGANTIHIDAI